MDSHAGSVSPYQYSLWFLYMLLLLTRFCETYGYELKTRMDVSPFKRKEKNLYLKSERDHFQLEMNFS